MTSRTVFCRRTIITRELFRDDRGLRPDGFESRGRARDGLDRDTVGSLDCLSLSSSFTP